MVHKTMISQEARRNVQRMIPYQTKLQDSSKGRIASKKKKGQMFGTDKSVGEKEECKSKEKSGDLHKLTHTMYMPTAAKGKYA